MRGASLLLALSLMLSLLSGAFALALHHHDECDGAARPDACSMCVVAKIAPAPPSAPIVLAVPVESSRSEPREIAAAPSLPRLLLHDGRGPPRG